MVVNLCLEDRKLSYINTVACLVNKVALKPLKLTMGAHCTGEFLLEVFQEVHTLRLAHSYTDSASFINYHYAPEGIKVQ